MNITVNRLFSIKKLGIWCTICLFSATLFLNGSISANASTSQSVLSISRGGTNAQTQNEALTNLGINNIINENSTNLTFPDAKTVYDYTKFETTFCSNKYVAVTGIEVLDGRIAYSYDAKNWSEISLTPVVDWEAVTCANGRFVAAGRNGYITYSDNGIDWQTPFYLGSSATLQYDFFTLTYGNDRFVAAGRNGYITYSTTGEKGSWATLYKGPLNMPFFSIKYGADKFVATIYNINNAAYITYSSNLTDWSTPINIDGIICYTTYKMCNIVFAQNKFVIASFGGYITYSNDGINWSKAKKISNYNYKDITYGKGKFITISNDGNIGYSYDLEIYQHIKIANSSRWNAITYSKGIFVAVGYSGQIAYSYDGVNWTTESVGNQHFSDII
ncbi:MAG: hypothetical protein LBT91_00370 [Bifidobacteriaceae bacterium]|jgi:hypothetical protein|nr:hypothetical protein [Bifidobacteriaceae bacterium]